MLIDRLHEKGIKGRRCSVLSKNISSHLSANATVLDVGCGSGEMALHIQSEMPDVTIHGIDVLVRPDASIPVKEFDGTTIPYSDNSYDYVLFIDVLHHTNCIKELILEAIRVSRKGVIIKDHTREGFLAFHRLAFMDQVGNKRFGVKITETYLSVAEWKQLFAEIGVDTKPEPNALGLYPWPLSVFFDANLHTIMFIPSKE
jgi:ubiquinone/menaquinone biosynthesis C-methylase UbiE